MQDHLVHLPSRSQPQFDDAPICSARVRVDRERRARPEAVWNALVRAVLNKGLTVN